MPSITIYTDGGCKPNPGPGGWGAVVLHGDGKKARLLRELSGGDDRTTNNRMEMTAAVEALRSVDAGGIVGIVTDSTYLKNGVTKWIKGWRKRGWKTQTGTPVLNQDLWLALHEEIRRVQVEWRWVKGHSGNRWNERADQLATRARKKFEGGRRPSPASGSLPYRAAEAEIVVDEEQLRFPTDPPSPAALHAAPASQGRPPLPLPPPPRAPALRGSLPPPAPVPVTPRVQVTAILGVACTGTRGTGAWVAVLIALGRERVVQGKTEGETANRLHLHAAVGALRALRMPVSIDIKTPSSYLRDGVLEVPTWKNRGWRTSTGKPVRNRDLWDELCLALADHEVRFVLPHRTEEEGDVIRAKALAQGALD